MLVGKILFATFRLYSDNLLQATRRLSEYNRNVANKILPTSMKSKIYRQHNMTLKEYNAQTLAATCGNDLTSSRQKVDTRWVVPTEEF